MALIGMTTSAEMHWTHHLRHTWTRRLRGSGPRKVGRGSFPSSQIATPSSPRPQTVSLPHTPALGPAAGCGEYSRLLITDLRAKLIFSSDRDVPLKNDFNLLPKEARLPQAVQHTPTTSAALRTSHKVDTSEPDWLKLLMPCPLRRRHH